jgi:hypothetical protein
MSKKVYQFDNNGIYLYPTEADESPLEPGVYLYPKNTTEQEPPQLNANELAQWNGEKWTTITVNEPNPVDILVAFFQKNPAVWEYVKDAVELKSYHK